VKDELETARLLLVAWSESAETLLARLSSEPRVVRYIRDGRCWSHQRSAEVSRAILGHWQEHGFGWRVAIEKQSLEPVGFIALNYLGDGTARLEPNEFEIGWWLDPGAWGRGLASEGARAVCEEAFASLRAPSVVARLQPANRASARVAERLGMSLEFETTGAAGEPVAVYRLFAADWVRPQGGDSARD
jgi:RimJ/RimL family protein N-acetyltransferase